ncbi:MAG: signal transduction histidine kinase [Mariniblastus sp.]|jgi:signal transduction histidine kinase
MKTLTGDKPLRHALKLLIPVAFLVLVAVVGIAWSRGSGPPARQLKRLTINQLKKRLAEIDLRLPKLAQYSLRSGVGAIGYRSQAYRDAAHAEWIQIELDQECSIDEIVLVPNLVREAESGFTAEGFPTEFRVIVGSGKDADGREVALFKAEDNLLPRMAPVVISTDGARGSWVRVEAERLLPRQYDGKFLLQLAEILVFCGQENVALRRSVTSSSDESTGSPAWDVSFVVDGFMPYLMDGPSGFTSRAYVSDVGIGNEPTITIDLETAHPLSHVNLHLVDQSDTVPQTFSGGFGIPRRLRIEGANQVDFSDATLLTEIGHESSFDTGPIIMRQFPVSRCRYVRLTAIDPYIYSNKKNYGSRIGFAEIELLASGQNVALKRPVQVNFANEDSRNLARLTDGNNFYGRILPVRRWISDLAKRHDLEWERPLVAAELNGRYVRQRTNLTRIIGLVVLIAAATLVGGWIFRQRAIIETRERIAADLHDELGANFHAIGLLSDLAQTNSESPEKLKPLLARMRDLTERTGTAASYCANMLESKGLYDDLVQDMRRSSARIMADLDHEITFEGEENLDALNPRKRIGLFLFHKECLINIIRHSGATRVTTRLSATPNGISLNISDNGTGLDNPGIDVPPSLRRRVRLLGGSASVRKPDGGGTHVELWLPLKRFRVPGWLAFRRDTES